MKKLEGIQYSLAICFGVVSGTFVALWIGNGWTGVWSGVIFSALTAGTLSLDLRMENVKSGVDGLQRVLHFDAAPLFKSVITFLWNIIRWPFVLLRFMYFEPMYRKHVYLTVVMAFFTWLMYEQSRYFGELQTFSLSYSFIGFVSSLVFCTVGTITSILVFVSFYLNHLCIKVAIKIKASFFLLFRSNYTSRV
jgi:hypothetical protein